MPKARHLVTIARPVGDVFSFLAQGENDVRWRPRVLDIAKVSGEGVGATYRQFVRGPLGRRIPADFQITELEPNRVIAFRTIAGPVRPEGRYDLAPAEGGTLVTFSLQADLAGLKRVLAPAVRKTMRSEVGALENLRAVLEQESASP
ncbi:hypothetical protein BH18ACT15_BH18ACT15_14740 [soil metagenome]